MIPTLHFRFLTTMNKITAADVERERGDETMSQCKRRLIDVDGPRLQQFFQQDIQDWIPGEDKVVIGYLTGMWKDVESVVKYRNEL